MNAHLQLAYSIGANEAKKDFEKTAKDEGGLIGGTLFPGVGGAIGGGIQSGAKGALGAGIGSLLGGLLFPLIARKTPTKLLLSAFGGGLGGRYGQRLLREPEGLEERLIGKWE